MDLRERLRREPPPFREVSVVRVTPAGGRLRRVTLAGDSLRGLPDPEPAASVRLLLPDAVSGALVVPSWTGNEFLLPDGTRPIIRTVTPRRFDARSLELDVDVVEHGDGPLSRWATSVGAAAPTAVSGPGRGWSVPADATGFLLAGDESALPAIAQLLEHLPPTLPVAVVVEVDVGGRTALPAHPGLHETWVERSPGQPPGSGLVDAVAASALPDGWVAWVAGEAAAVHRIRRMLFDERGLPRSRAVVRGYWKHGRAGGDAD